MWILKKLLNLALGAIALPFVLLMRLFSPFVTVRILVLDISRVGHVLPHFDMYFSRRKAGLHGARNFDICCFSKGKVANYQIKKMVERTIPIFPFAFWVDKVNRRIPRWEEHVVSTKRRLDRNLADATVPSLSFTQKEIERGQIELNKLGIPHNHRFICFHARDASYLNTYQPQVNWDYHTFRNADINNYIPAVEEIVSKRYFAIRMGRFVSKELSSNNPKIIDYATNGGTDFLDMYLSAHCHFFIAGSDGLAEMPTIFRRPVVWIDFIPFSAIHLIAKGQLFIPKKLWSLKENRILTFDEMLNTEVAKYGRTEDYQKTGLEVIDNSPQEILDVSLEMEERLQGTWSETDKDKELQQELCRIVQDVTNSKFVGKIGAKFLRHNQELLNKSMNSSRLFQCSAWPVSKLMNKESKCKPC